MVVYMENAVCTPEGVHTGLHPPHMEGVHEYFITCGAPSMWGGVMLFVHYCVHIAFPSICCASWKNM